MNLSPLKHPKSFATIAQIKQINMIADLDKSSSIPSSRISGCQYGDFQPELNHLLTCPLLS